MLSQFNQTLATPFTYFAKQTHNRTPIIGIVTSNESFDSAPSTRRIIEDAQQKGYETLELRPRDVVMQVGANGLSLHYKNPFLVKKLPDVVIPRIDSSSKQQETQEAIRLLSFIEAMGIPSTTSAQGVSLCDDKLATHIALGKHHVPQPETLYSQGEGSREVEKKLIARLPETQVVHKALTGSEGTSVTFPSKREALKQLGSGYIVQEFMPPEDTAEDFRYLVLDGEVVGAIKRKSNEKNKLVANMSQGGIGEMIKPEPHEAALAKQAAEILGLKVAGVDIMRTPEGSKIIEVNSSPSLIRMENAFTKAGAAGDFTRRLVDMAATLAYRNNFQNLALASESPTKVLPEQQTTLAVA